MVINIALSINPFYLYKPLTTRLNNDSIWSHLRTHATTQGKSELDLLRKMHGHSDRSPGRHCLRVVSSRVSLLSSTALVFLYYFFSKDIIIIIIDTAICCVPIAHRKRLGLIKVDNTTRTITYLDSQRYRGAQYIIRQALATNSRCRRRPL